MDDMPIAPWLLLVPTYVAMARIGGSTWLSIVLTPTVAVLVVLIEFGVPPMLSREGGWSEVTIVAVGALAVVGAHWLRGRAPQSPRHVPT